MNNSDFMNALNIAAFVIGLANYQENLTQSDKDDILKSLDDQTKTLLSGIKDELEQQNKMLKEIIERLRNEQGH